MRIDSSAIGMESARRYTSSKNTVRRFSITDYRQDLTQGGRDLNTALSTGQGGRNTQDLMWSNDLSDWQGRFEMSSSRVTIRSNSDGALSQIRQMAVRYIFDLLFSGRSATPFQEWTQEYSSSQSFSVTGSGVNASLSASQNSTLAGMQDQSWQAEEETTAFSTVGTVRTADGREIKFNVNVGMSRQFEQYVGQDVDWGAAVSMCDPLVINLGADVAGLSDQTFYFDIDADGTKDEIAALNAGSGYLALDKNGDGEINDGRELFGTQTGNGFGDLAKYDADGNGWIDENDPIWSQLKIWCKDADGNDVLYRLADKGVGAICLQNVSTDFTLKDGSQTQGAIRNTGIFLYENGAAGTVQHVDMAKYVREA